jgi:hypothetical protein
VGLDPVCPARLFAQHLPCSGLGGDWAALSELAEHAPVAAGVGSVRGGREASDGRLSSGDIGG